MNFQTSLPILRHEKFSLLELQYLRAYGLLLQFQDHKDQLLLRLNRVHFPLELFLTAKAHFHHHSTLLNHHILSLLTLSLIIIHLYAAHLQKIYLILKFRSVFLRIWLQTGSNFQAQQCLL